MSSMKLFQEESRQLHHRRVYSILLVGIGVMLSLTAYDYFLVPEHFSEFFRYRLFSVGFSGLLLVANYQDRLRQRSWIIGFSGYIGAGMIILLTMHRMGGSTSAYYVGLIVAMTMYTAIAPLTVTQTLISGFALVCIYLISMFFVDSISPDHWMTLFNNLFFMVCFVFITATQSWAETAARMRECLLRTEENEAAEALGRQAETLENEVRTRTEEQKVSEKRYRILYEALADDVVLLATQGMVLQANRSYYSHFCKGEWNHPVSFFDAVRPQDREIVRAKLYDVIERGRPLSAWQITLLSSDGGPVEVEINGAPLYWYKEILGVQLVIRDISIRKKLERELVTSLDKVKQTEDAAILALAKLSEYRDVRSLHHLERIREYCRTLAVELSRRPELQYILTPEYIRNLYQGVILHDIGKVAIADDILQHKGSLTAQEEEILRNHTVTGGDVIKAMEREAQGSGFLSLAKNIAYFHHERWDGSGYPFALKGGDIPLEARIMAVADAYEALTATLTPEKILSHHDAMDRIIGSAGHHLDPMIVNAFVVQQDTFARIHETLAETA